LKYLTGWQEIMILPAGFVLYQSKKKRGVPWVELDQSVKPKIAGEAIPGFARYFHLLYFYL
jgi:hypothetical protein